MVSLMSLSSVMALLRYRNINRGHVTILLTSMLAAFTIAKDFTIHSSALLFYNFAQQVLFCDFQVTFNTFIVPYSSLVDHSLVIA